MEKSQELGMSFFENFTQQPALTGSLLSKLIPWRTEKIEMDGNCFFRCVSKMLTGTEIHHIRLRAEVCRYMVTTGRALIKIYLKTFSKDSSPINYLKQSGMTGKGIWATDVEVMAVSGMLNSDVYIATEQFNAQNNHRRTIWNRYSCCIDCSRYPRAVSLYISNIRHIHYEPVTRLMNSVYDSFMIENYVDSSTAGIPQKVTGVTDDDVWEVEK